MKQSIKSPQAIIAPYTTIKHALAHQFRRHPTPTEAVLWSHLRGKRLGVNFRRQQVIDGFIVDFYCHQLGLVIEVDGLIHEQQQEYDAERTRILERRGFQILRFSNEQITTNKMSVIGEIRKTIIDKLEEMK
jgi:very-short-patch-repair endonuclease